MYIYQLQRYSFEELSYSDVSAKKTRAIVKDLNQKEKKMNPTAKYVVKEISVAFALSTVSIAGFVVGLRAGNMIADKITGKSEKSW